MSDDGGLAPGLHPLLFRFEYIELGQYTTKINDRFCQGLHATAILHHPTKVLDAKGQEHPRIGKMVEYAHN